MYWDKKKGPKPSYMRHIQEKKNHQGSLDKKSHNKGDTPKQLIQAKGVNKKSKRGISSSRITTKPPYNDLTKRDLSSNVDDSTPSKVLKLRSFQIHQKKAWRTIFQTTLKSLRPLLTHQWI